jgi:hypothetical protein
MRFVTVKNGSARVLHAVFGVRMGLAFRAGQRFSPEGTNENSPAFQRWGSNPKASQVPKGRKKRAAILCFCRPCRDSTAGAFVPSVETMGFCLSPLRGSCRPCLRNPRLKPWAILGRPCGTKELSPPDPLENPCHPSDLRLISAHAAHVEKESAAIRLGSAASARLSIQGQPAVHLATVGSTR